MIRLLPALAAAILLASCAGAADPAGLRASARASGDAKMTAGAKPFDLASAQSATGTISVEATDAGNRWSHLQNRDRVSVRAEWTQGADRFAVTIEEVMPRHPKGKYTTWSGVVYETTHHGRTGIGSSDVPATLSEILIWGYADVTLNGREVARDAPAHVMVTTEGAMKGVVLEVAAEDRSLVGVRDGYLVVHWPTVASIAMPEAEERNREYLGWAVLIAVVLLFGWLAMREPATPRVLPVR